MIFNNINNLKVVSDFEANFGSQLCEGYPELANMDIMIYTDKLGTGFIKKWNDSNNSPYTSNHAVTEIMRSEDVYNECGFTEKEEFAILAHELGHVVAGKRGQKSDNNLQEELNADQMAVSLGLANHMASSLQKMIDLNINPANNEEMKRRIDALNQKLCNCGQHLPSNNSGN